MKTYLTRTGKWLFGLAFLAIVLWVAFFATGCGSSTVVPERVEARSIAYEGNEQTAGILGLLEGGAVISERKKAEYDELVALYGRGTAEYAITPPVKKGRGLARVPGRSVGFPQHGWVWKIDGEALSWLMTFREWQRTGRRPR